MTSKTEKLQAVLNNAVDGKKIFGTSFAVKKGDFSWEGSAGNIASHKKYFIASTTKLFVTALILQLRSENKLELDNKIHTILAPNVLKNLHIYKGKDYSKVITIKHLLSHTSGIPDYFQQKVKNGKSLESEVKSGKDQFWSFEQAVDKSKSMNPHFAPGTKGKALYSDTNFQLLGKIIEQISGKSFEENCVEKIIKPLSLASTYLYTSETDSQPQALHFKSIELNIPKAMTSFWADGGMVSTSADMLIFIEAFFLGHLFPKSYINELQEWNSIFFPMKSGVGIHLFKLPWIFNPTGAVPAFIGHSGLSGALAFYCPSENIFIVGTVNQVAHPDTSFRTMIKLAQTLKK